MVKGPGGRRSTPVISQERIDEVDEKFYTPKERAEGIWALLQTGSKTLEWPFNEYDITCFCAQWLAMLAVGPLAENERFVDLAKEVNKWVHSVHYTEAEEIFGKEGDREDDDDGREREDGDTPPDNGATPSDDAGELRE